MEHMNKVFEICRELGLKPEFWADAFYDTERPDEEVQAIFDGTQTPIYWDYYKDDKAYHVEKLKKLQNYAGERFAQLYPEFQKLAEQDSHFAYIFKAYAAMCKVLIHKATYSKRLYQAYQENDRNKLLALVARADTVTKVLNDYLDGKMEKIYELEEERIEYFCGQLSEEEMYAPLHNCWTTAYTVNHL